MFYSPQHNAVVYNDMSEEHARHVSNYKTLEDGSIAFKATLENLQVAAYFGYEIPGMMDRYYNWPSNGLKPFIAQRITSNFLAHHFRCFCFNDMGTGKTLSILWAADYVMREYDQIRAIIICPKTITERVWASHIFEHFMGKRTCVVLEGEKKKRAALLKQKHDFYIINFDGVRVIKDELAARDDIQIVAIDEGSAYRDWTTERHRIMRKTLLKRKYFWIATGTPRSNGPLDAYGLAKLINNAYGESFSGYRSRVVEKVSNFRWVPKANSGEEAAKLLTPAIRFSSAECVDLPEFMPPVTREVALSEQQEKAYKIMKQQCLLMVKSGKPITAVNEAVLRLKLIQIACGAIYSGQGADREVHRLDASPRLNELKQIINECENKIIIVAPLTAVLHVIKDALPNYSTAIVNGENTKKENDQVLKDFQEKENPRILIGDPTVIAYGLTLVMADIVIWYAPTDKSELYIQTNFRINRPGQTRKTQVVNLAASPIERAIYKRVANNLSLQGLFLEMVQNG